MSAKVIYEKYCNGALPVIDIGCGQTKLFDFEYVRFDKAIKYNNSSTDTFANHYGDFHSMPAFADNTFVFVNSRHSIEHAKYPEIALKEWTRILKVGGIMFIEYPGWLESRNPEQKRKDFVAWEDALSRKDTELYMQLGGEMGWVSMLPNGDLFLDGHYNILSMQEMKDILPKNLKVLEENVIGDFFLVLQKE